MVHKHPQGYTGSLISHFVNVLGYSEPMGEGEETRGGENYNMRRFIICSLRPILLG
jgi:hypothetical protein